MITLAIINFFLDLGSRFILNFLSGIVEPLNDLTSYITLFSLPQTLIDIYSLATYFLPMTTISILLLFTASLIIAKTLLSIAHFGFGIIFGS